MEKIRELVKNYLGEESVHGFPHLERVYSWFKLFLKGEPPLDKEALEALEMAVLLHDIGRSKPDRDHTIASAEIVGLMFQKELSFIPDHYRPWITHAIKGHSRGLEGYTKEEVKKKENILLGLLVVFDHADAIGPIGILRAIVALGTKIPWLPKMKQSLFFEKVKNHLDHPETITIADIETKNDSIAEHLIYNYCATHRIIAPVEKFVPTIFQVEIEKKLKAMRLFIEVLC